MPQLPDPRVFACAATSDPLAALAAAGEPAALAAAVRAELVRGGDGIDSALRAAPGPAAYRLLWDAVCAGAEASAGDGVAARLFALPVVIVAGARSRATIPGVLPEPAKLAALLAEKGAVGATQNFGLSNSLCAPEVLERVTPAEVLSWTNGDLGAVPRDFPAAPIPVEPGREQVHLRYLVGAGITPHGAPSFLESASNIGTWGIALAQLLAAQLRVPGVELLAVPRPPLALLRAPHGGRSALLAMARDLFLSNAIRRFRSSVGDPAAVVSAHRLDAGGAEIRLSLSSVLDESMLDGYVWPLHPLDDLAEIECDMAAALADCRVNDVQWVGRILPERLARGLQFVTADAAAAAAGPH